jgi:hypothetical protein
VGPDGWTVKQVDRYMGGFVADDLSEQALRFGEEVRVDPHRPTGRLATAEGFS